jgi:hypothetical protein
MLFSVSPHLVVECRVNLHSGQVFLEHLFTEPAFLQCWRRYLLVSVTPDLSNLLVPELCIREQSNGTPAAEDVGDTGAYAEVVCEAPCTSDESSQNASLHWRSTPYLLRDDVECALQMQIGEGTYGVVHKLLFDGELVAVKLVKVRKQATLQGWHFGMATAGNVPHAHGLKNMMFGVYGP